MIALYEREGDSFVPGDYTRGPWSREHQHAGPPAALLAHTVEQVAGIRGGHPARLSFDILGPIPVAPLTASAEVIRPGRAVELVRGELAHDGEVVMRATVWRMRDQAQDLGDPEPPPPPPESLPEGDLSWWRPGEIGWLHGLEWRAVHGWFKVPGPGSAWARVRGQLVAGEEITPLERLLVMADAASGVSSVLDWDTWMFINVDLGIHLERPPEGEWMALDARTTLGDRGAGLSQSTLYDRRGRVGLSTQSLLVGPR